MCYGFPWKSCPSIQTSSPIVQNTIVSASTICLTMKHLLFLTHLKQSLTTKGGIMNRLNFFKISRKNALIISCCLAVFLAIAVYLHLKGEQHSPTFDVAAPNIEKKTDSIAIPGYEMLELTAGNKQQTLCLSNPKQNMCYFQISLYLKDGTLLWQSELIKPGTTSKPMVLVESIPKGTYPKAILRYACYRMDEDLTPLNGAETKVTLRVK